MGVRCGGRRVEQVQGSGLEPLTAASRTIASTHGAPADTVLTVDTRKKTQDVLVHQNRFHCSILFVAPQDKKEQPVSRTCCIRRAEGS